MSKRSVPTPASSQCADEERRGCGTDVPEPSTVSFISPSAFTLSPYPFPLLPSRRGLARELLVAHGGLVDEGGHDDGGLLHVVLLYALVGVLGRVVRARVVVNRVLYELEAGQADGVEREVVGAARVRERQGLRAQVVERREPLAEER